MDISRQCQPEKLFPLLPGPGLGMSAFLPKLDFLFCRLGRTPVECMNSRSLNIACQFTNKAFIESIYISEQDGMIFIMKCVS